MTHTLKQIWGVVFTIKLGKGSADAFLANSSKSSVRSLGIPQNQLDFISDFDS